MGSKARRFRKAGERMARTIDDVKKDYAQACTQLGDIEYQTARVAKLRAELIVKMDALQDEAAKLIPPKDADAGSSGKSGDVDAPVASVTPINS
jgi:hypothetical protein